MFKRLAISLTIDIKNKDIFESLLIKYRIPINPKGRVPRVASSYYAEQGITVCHYYNLVFDYQDFEKIEMKTTWHEDVAVNEYLNTYLTKYQSLSHVKNYLLSSSYLLLIFEGTINHADIVEFTSETIFNLANLGLGISYNHVYEA